MKLINYLLIALIFVSSCKEESDPEPSFSKDYGDGMYIVTDNGVSFYDGDVVKNQIYQTVNGYALSNPKKIKFQGTKAYIVTEKSLFSANVETFESIGESGGFMNLVDFDFISDDRLLALDNGNSKVNVVDIEKMEITSDIETGDSTRPVFILSNSSKSFVMNGGGGSEQIKDSTVAVIEYRDGLVALANFAGNLFVGDNPNSAVFSSTGALKVLSQGVYVLINSINNTESSFSDINQYSNQVYSTNTLTGIYNAQNLISSGSNSAYYLTAEGGVYELDPSNLNVNLIVSVNASIINTMIESLAINDSTTVSYEMLYMNDEDSPNTIYKYNLDLSLFIDTIIVDSHVNDVAFY
jgi:hypothetical protein